MTVRLLRQLSPIEAPSVGGTPLTDRELDIVALVADGLTNPEIGVELFITAGTVKTHLTHVQQKLGVRNRVGIAAWAWETGHRRGGQPPGSEVRSSRG